MDEGNVATELGSGALSSCIEGGKSEDTTCRPESEPSAEVGGSTAGIAPNCTLSRTTVDEAGSPPDYGAVHCVT